MREVHLKPKSKRIGLHNYLPEPFTFRWDKEDYTLKPGETDNYPEWMATHAAIKMAERWFVLNPANASSTDPKIKGYFSRHDENFKAKVREALVYPENFDGGGESSELRNAVSSMNADDDKPAKRKKGEIELPEVDDEPITGGCAECSATGPRHKPTCSKFKPHEKDAAQKAKLEAAAS